jgi:hypothetical protein
MKHQPTTDEVTPLYNAVMAFEREPNQETAEAVQREIDRLRARRGQHIPITELIAANLRREE